MDILNTKIKNILTEKTLKVRPENIKKDVEVFGITGTYEGMVPSGTVSITENGTVDVTNYASADVNVSGSAQIVFPSKIRFTGADFTGVDFDWIKNADTSKLKSMDSIFSESYSPSTYPNPLDLTNWSTENVASLYTAFSSNTVVKAVKLNGLNLSNVRNLESAFYNATNLETLEMKNITISNQNLTSARSMFYGCSKLSTLLTENTSISNVNVLENLFQGCTSLTSMDLNWINPGNNSSLYQAFRGCTKLQSVDISSFANNKIASMRMCFYGCSKLETINFGNNATISSMSNSTGLTSAFSNCPMLNNATLNNILGLISTATSYPGTKTLAAIGLSSAQATTCTGLSNWSAAQTAGWTTGY